MDIGAFESQGFIINTNAPGSQPVTSSFSVSINLSPNTPGEPVAGGQLTLAVTTGTGGASATFPPIPATLDSNGTATVTGTANGIAGAFSFTPAASGAATVAPVPLVNTPVGVNDAYPVTTDGSLTIAAPGVLANDRGGPLTAQIVTPPAHAVAFTLNADGSFMYTPTVGFVGGDAFIYQAHGNDGTLSNTVTVTLTIAAGTPGAITVTAGASQSAQVITAFPTALQATVTTSGGVPAPNAAVTFTAPTSGPSGAFPGGVTTVTVTANGSGVATAPPFTANGTVGGPYTVNATVAGVATPASFTLTNTAAPLTSITLTGPGGTTTPSAKVGQTIQLTAMGIYGSGPPMDLTTQVRWTSSDPTKATVDPTSGKVTGQSPGQVTITATLNGITQTITVTVGAPTPIGITVPPAPASRPSGAASGAGQPAPAPMPSVRPPGGTTGSPAPPPLPAGR